MSRRRLPSGAVSCLPSGKVTETLLLAVARPRLPSVPRRRELLYRTILPTCPNWSRSEARTLGAETHHEANQVTQRTPSPLPSRAQNFDVNDGAKRG